MKILRFESENGKIRYGRRIGGGVVSVITNPFEGPVTDCDDKYDLEDLKLLAPVEAGDVIAIGLNYRKHAEECNMELPEQPVVFLKASSSVIGPGDDIVLPAVAPDEVDYECELAIIIGRTAKNVSEDEVFDYVLGYTCANDVSARDCQLKLDRQWARGKSFDTFCPLGPWIETDLKPGNLNIKTMVNDQVMQDSSTSDFIFNVRYLVSYLSKCMTLRPGTVILTGTPSGVGVGRTPQVYLKEGDKVEVYIEGIGSLINNVVKEQI